MWDNLYRHIDISPQNVNVLNGNAEDLDAESARYEAKLTSVGAVNPSPTAL